MLISCIHHTSELKQYCHVGNTGQQCRLGLFQDSDFAGDLEDSKSTSGWVLWKFARRTFVPRIWATVKCGVRTHQYTLFSRWVSVVHFRRQRSCHQDDCQRTKSDNETCFADPQSCAWLVVRQDKFGAEGPNQICWHRKPTCWHADHGQFHAWWMGPSDKRSKIPFRKFFSKNPSCKCWHLFVCQNFKSETRCKNGRRCFFRYVEAEGTPSKKSKKGGAKGSVALFKESTQMCCASQDSYPRKSFSTWRTKKGIKTRRQILQGHVAPKKKSGKRGSIARNYPKVWTSWA